MPGIRVYLDTSVISALHDPRWPERQKLTRAFWQTRHDFDLAGSEVTRHEIEQTTDDQLRAVLLKSLGEFDLVPLTDEMRDLARLYVREGILPPGSRNDALHVACSTMAHRPVLLSWNFRHLVNRWRRAAFNAVNARLNLPTIEIIAAPELSTGS